MTIEAVIAAVPGVWECAVVGVEHPDFGERPVAFVVPRRGTHPEVLRMELVDSIEKGLGRIKRPDALYFVDELPRSPTGKLLRRQLRTLSGRG